MDLITAVMGDQATEVEVTAVLIVVVVVELVVPAVAAVEVVVVMGGMVVHIDLLQQVMDMMVAQEQGMVVMVEGMAMEAMLALGLVLVVVMVDPCMEVHMVHMAPMVVVLMEEVPMEAVHMEVAPMVAPQVMALADMAVMVEQVEQVVVLLVGVQVLGALAGIIHMENKRQVQSIFLGLRSPSGLLEIQFSCLVHLNSGIGT